MMIGSNFEDRFEIEERNNRSVDRTFDSTDAPVLVKYRQGSFVVDVLVLSFPAHYPGRAKLTVDQKRPDFL